MSVNNSNTNNFYSILNINKNASKDKIKRAYKKLVIKNHPDKNINSPNIDQYKIEFIKIQEAYETLSDESKRKLYDLKLNNYNYNDKKTTIKIKKNNILNFIKNASFYMILFDKLANSSFEFINNFIVDGNILKILDIEKTIDFTIYEYYNNIPKLYKHERLTGGIFEEHIFAIDQLQIYENEGEQVNIDEESINGNLIINIKITNMTYKKMEYYIYENDLILFVKNKNIKNNKIKLKFLDNKSYSFEINNLKKVTELVNNKLEINNNSYSNIYYIENFGLPYFDNNQNMKNIDLNKIKRGNLFFILVV